MIERWDAAVDGALSEEALRRKLEAQGYSVSRYVYPPGTHFPDHTHGVEKKDAVVSGSFRIELEGQPFTLGPGDCVKVPRNAVHNATVVGDAPVASLDAVRQ